MNILYKRSSKNNTAIPIKKSSVLNAIESKKRDSINFFSEDDFDFILE